MSFSPFPLSIRITSYNVCYTKLLRSDLIDDVGSTTNRGSVPVNCVLKLTDDLMNPTIKFDIDLPSSDEGVKQKVKSIINTDEMMNRQIAYLLILNKFYIPEATTTTSTNTGSYNFV